MFSKKHVSGLLLTTALLWGAFSTSAQEEYKNKRDLKLFYENHEIQEVKDLNLQLFKKGKHPKNVILLIGDGMGVSQVFSGITANRGNLYMMQMPVGGFSMTQSADHYVTDSAAGGTALACGKRTKNGAIGVDPEGKPVQSILEFAETRGKATGLVATSAITHATPASFIAHQPKRSMYEEIAADFLNTDIEVFIGGGYKHFTERKDKRDLTKELKAKNYEVLNGLDKIMASNAKKLAGFTADVHNPEAEKRGDMLIKSTEKALEILKQNKKGFFLMVEGSQIDWGGHGNNTEKVVRETLDFDQAVGKVLEFAAKDKNTLVIITADHETGGMSLLEGSVKDGKVEAKFTTGHHSAVMVPVFAYGPGAEEFGGVQKNVDIFKKMKELMK